MKKVIAAAILVFAAGGAFAQTNAPAVATSTTQSPAAPIAGANSFTESQAKAMPKDYRFRSALSVKSYNSIPDGMCRP
jgi:hypothetical protein